MNVDLPVTSSRTRALEHVTSLSFGAPLDAGVCVTLNFHPDRAVAGRPILERLREDGLYVSKFLDARIIGGAVRSGRHDPQDLKRVWHLPARFGRTSVAGPAGG
ncbi:DUF3626 domain-containing protein [Streptomyces sp. NBC_01116]|uniref:hypothetical protein n=1 Tax=Streptomyces sp. NBC_01116 TaxID=2903752 RepID=UPI0032553300